MTDQSEEEKEKQKMRQQFERMLNPSNLTRPPTSITMPQSPKSQGDIDHDEQSGELMVSQPQPNEGQFSFGKCLVLVQSKYVTLTLGPDYFVFLPIFSIFAIVAYLTCSYIDTHSDKDWVKLLTKIMCLGQLGSYLLIALSDPGMARPREEVKTGKNRTTFCRRCKFNVPSKSFHCMYCDVCIEGYDHHCAWISKCVGRKNTIRFYVFLLLTPVFVVYCAFAFGFTSQGHQGGQNHLKG